MQTPHRPVNFRDLGGIPVANGRKVAPCRLLRCGEPTQLSAEDAALLTGPWQLKTIVDLRTPQEQQKSPNTLLAGVEQITIDLTEPGSITASGDALSSIPHEAQVHEFMKALYRGFINTNAARAGQRRFLEVLLDRPEGAVLFHCFAGKDRTGLSAAVILTVLGASREEIFADYLRTNAQRAEENGRILQGMKAQGVSEEQLAGVSAALCVEADYLEECYKEAKALYGSFEAYIYEGIGLSQQEAERLRQMYLVP